MDRGNRWGGRIGVWLLKALLRDAARVEGSRQEDREVGINRRRHFDRTAVTAGFALGDQGRHQGVESARRGEEYAVT